jgi:hypothetical protein
MMMSTTISRLGNGTSDGQRDAGQHRQQLFAQRFSPWSRIRKLAEHERHPPVGEQHRERDERRRDNDAGESCDPRIASGQPPASSHPVQIPFRNRVHTVHGTTVRAGQHDNRRHEEEA